MPDDPRHASRIDLADDPKAYPLRRAFLMLSMPFALLGLFVAALVWWVDDGGDGTAIAPSQRVERRMEGIRATGPADAPRLIEARNAAPEAWSEPVRDAFRGLVERTGWPSEAGAQDLVTASRLTQADPSDWNADERASAQTLLDLFERYWFTQPSGRR